MSETLGLKNVNLLSKEQYNGVEEPNKEELWAIEVETYYDDDGNWYRIYPDGWCEQGGTISGTKPTVNFLKEFKDTSYYINWMFQDNTNTATLQFQYQSVNSKTSTSAIINNSGGTSFTMMWEAKGYIR